MKYTFEVKNEIKRCGDCPCNMNDGHEFYCRLSKKFNADPKKDCKLVPINNDDKVGGTCND